MALLEYKYQEKSYAFNLPTEKGILSSLQTQTDQQWEFFQDANGQEYPIQIIRADNGFYILIVDSQNQVRVNDIIVFGLRVLRNSDTIQSGEGEIHFYEWIRQEVKAGSKQLGIECPFCRVSFTVNDQVMLCPKCDTPHHDYCWDTVKHCPSQDCGFIVPSDPPYTVSRVMN